MPNFAPAAPRVSVILTCANAAAYVGEAIESVLAQSRRADELIVVDDGSDDDSAAVIQRFGAALTCVRQDALGIAAARNRGVLQASGDIGNQHAAGGRKALEVAVKYAKEREVFDRPIGQIKLMRYPEGAVPERIVHCGALQKGATAAALFDAGFALVRGIQATAAGLGSKKSIESAPAGVCT